MPKKEPQDEQWPRSHSRHFLKPISEHSANAGLGIAGFPD